MNEQKIVKKIVKFIKSQAGDKKAVLGLSGGVDSAVVASLAVAALGKNRVLGLFLPSATNSNEDKQCVRQLINKIGIKIKTVSINKTMAGFAQSTNIFKNIRTIGNLKARVRMAILYGFANEQNAIVLGTGNKSEIMVGYYTKYGDGGVDILPIGDLYKTQVRALARYLKIPQQIIERAPTAGLWKGQTDEGEMGITYENLDKILEAIGKKKTLNKFNGREVFLVKKMVKASAHKRVMPAVCRFV